MRRRLLILLMVVVGGLAVSSCGRRETKVTHPVTPEPPFLQMEAFREEQLRWIGLAESFCVSEVTVPEMLTSQDKAAFFQYIISTSLYEDRLAKWQTPEGYEIPLAEVEEIVFTHLDTDTFDPEDAFPDDPALRRWYDRDKQVYHTSMLGGYGGARAFGVLEYAQEENRLRILLGLYEMNSFYSDPPEYLMLDRWETEFLLTGEGERDFKVLRSEQMEIPPGQFTVYKGNE